MQASVSETFLEEVAEPVTAEIIKEMEASGMGNTDTTVELADSPTIGDASNVFLIKLKTEAFSLDFYGLFFVQGRVIAELMAVGPPGKLALEDVVHLAQLIDQRIQENSPSP